jgi:hypothetical protein
MQTLAYHVIEVQRQKHSLHGAHSHDDPAAEFRTCEMACALSMILCLSFTDRNRAK